MAFDIGFLGFTRTREIPQNHNNFTKRQDATEAARIFLAALRCPKGWHTSMPLVVATHPLANKTSSVAPPTSIFSESAALAVAGWALVAVATSQAATSANVQSRKSADL